MSIVFEPDDTLTSIASVCRCTTDELASLMETIWRDDWTGQPVDWRDNE